MKSIVGLIIIFFFMTGCGYIMKENEEKKECRTYPAEMMIEGIDVVCSYNKEVYLYMCTFQGQEFIVYQYNSHSDFIQEGKKTGAITRQTEKITEDFSTYKMYSYLYNEKKSLFIKKTDINLDGNYDDGTATVDEWDEQGRPIRVISTFIIQGYECTNVTQTYEYDDENLVMTEINDYGTSEECKAGGLVKNILYFNENNYLVKAELGNGNMTIKYTHIASKQACE